MQSIWKTVIFAICGSLVMIGFFIAGLQSGTSDTKPGKVSPHKSVKIDVLSPEVAGPLLGRP